MRYLCGTFIVGAIASQSAVAGYTFDFDGVQAEATLAGGAANVATRNINFGTGGIDQRNGESIGQKAQWQEFYLKPGTTLQYALDPKVQLLGGVSVVAATTLGDGDAGGYTRGSDGQVALEEAYAGVRSGDWTFTAGDQNYKIGTGFIVMAGKLNAFDKGAYWLQPRTAFSNSAIVSYAHDAVQAQAFSLEASDDVQGDYRLSGANFDYKLWDAVTLGAMAMGVKSVDNGRNFTAPRDGMRVYNLRALNGHVPGLAALTLNGEYAIQRGSGDGVDYGGMAWYAQADYQFAELPLTPLVGYRYAVFSGDKDPLDNHQKSWDPLSKGYVDWSTWLIGDVVGNYLLYNSNERVSQFSVKTHLSPTVTLGGIHYQFSLDEKNYQGVAVNDRRFADENVIFLDWTPNERVYTSISYNWVKPLEGARQVFGNDTFSALEMYVTYRY
jgi:hypothetical protein